MRPTQFRHLAPYPDTGDSREKRGSRALRPPGTLWDGHAHVYSVRAMPRGNSYSTDRLRGRPADPKQGHTTAPGGGPAVVAAQAMPLPSAGPLGNAANTAPQSPHTGATLCRGLPGSDAHEAPRPLAGSTSWRSAAARTRRACRAAGARRQPRTPTGRGRRNAGATYRSLSEDGSGRNEENGDASPQICLVGATARTRGQLSTMPPTLR